MGVIQLFQGYRVVLKIVMIGRQHYRMHLTKYVSGASPQSTTFAQLVNEFSPKWPVST